jgi:hypothetical protein
MLIGSKQVLFRKKEFIPSINYVRRIHKNTNVNGNIITKRANNINILSNKWELAEIVRNQGIWKDGTGLMA